jgi:hypothetical protein
MFIGEFSGMGYNRFVMAIKRRCFAVFIVPVLGAWLVGCQSDGTSTGRSSNASQLPAAVVSNLYVHLDQPSVTIDDGNVVISGAVRRKPGIRWLLVGRVDIEFVASNGYVLDELPALITPGTVSMDPNVPSLYSTSYGYIPPAGSSVRVHYVDSDTAAREDIEGYDFGSVGGAVAAGPGAGNHGAPAKRNEIHYGRGGFGMGMGFH